MIPKRAIFYWSGGVASDLRRLSWETFASLNPDWEIVMLGAEDNEPNYRKLVIGSDLARYKALHEIGGYYFDTDIVFRRPIPGSWLERDNACVLTPHGMALGIGVLGGKTGSNLWRCIHQVAIERARSPIQMECQSLGIKLMMNLDGPNTDLRFYAAKLGEGLFPIPPESLFPFGADSIEYLWSPGHRKPSPECLGVHWFGGDRLSQEFEAAKVLPDCFVRSVVEEALNGRQ